MGTKLLQTIIGADIVMGMILTRPLNGDMKLRMLCVKPQMMLSHIMLRYVDVSDS